MARVLEGVRLNKSIKSKGTSMKALSGLGIGKSVKQLEQKREAGVRSNAKSFFRRK